MFSACTANSILISHYKIKYVKWVLQIRSKLCLFLPGIGISNQCMVGSKTWLQYHASTNDFELNFTFGPYNVFEFSF